MDLLSYSFHSYRASSKWISQEYSRSQNEPLSLTAIRARMCPSGLSCSHMRLFPYGCGLPYCHTHHSNDHMSRRCCFLTKPESEWLFALEKNSFISQKNLKFSSFICFLLHFNVSWQVWLLAWRGSLEVKMAENWELGAVINWSTRNKSRTSMKITVSQFALHKTLEKYIHFVKNKRLQYSSHLLPQNNKFERIKLNHIWKWVTKLW